MRLQQLNIKILGCLKNQLIETETDNTTLPPTEDRKGKIAAWDRQTGALTYFGNRGMDEIYLNRNKNLSDLTDVDAAREHLNIIDGRQLENNSKPVEHRHYNNERQFLKASTTAGKKTDAGLPNIYGRIFNNWQRRNPYGSTVGGDGAFRSTVLDANADVKAAYGPQYDSDRHTTFNAADSNPIYGRSNTVQPPAQDIIYLIKFQG